MTKKFIKEKWKEVCAAKRERNDAEQKIITTNVIKQPDVCITNVLVVTDNNSTLHSCKCEHFEEHKICDNVNCPMHTKNMHYVLADEKYKHLRRDFFRMLFRGRQKNS